MKVEKLIQLIGADFYAGVPDSQLRALCDYLICTYGTDPAHHIIAANEGNAVAIAAGYHLASGKVPVVYMQNSGEGNIINPVMSLISPEVYAIPLMFIIGWRGEPGFYDEPQHIYQGKVTLKLLDDMGICYSIINSETTEKDIQNAMHSFKAVLSANQPAAFVISKNALEYDKKAVYKNIHTITREEAIYHITQISGNDPIISTTGKSSRELFELRKAAGQEHSKDFLTIGSMGHSSSIALGVALQKQDRRIWCIDGDGAAIMHLGAMAVIGTIAPKNLIHVIINNEAHESVGGMPTVAAKIDFETIARGCGYPYTFVVETLEQLNEVLNMTKEIEQLCLIEIKCSIGARPDLGRPTTSALENKDMFMRYLKK